MLPNTLLISVRNMYPSHLPLLRRLILLKPIKRRVIPAKLRCLLIHMQPVRVINVNHPRLVLIPNYMDYILLSRLYNTSTFPDHHAPGMATVVTAVVVKDIALVVLTEVTIYHSYTPPSPIHSFQGHTDLMKTRCHLKYRKAQGGD